MSENLEQQLREALRPVDPDDGFDARVMSRIQIERTRAHGMRHRWLAAALAASIAIAAVIFHAQQSQREREGLEARKQLLEALRVTGEKLDIAYHAVNREPPPPNENRRGA
jgi:hypothetical protein